MKTSHKIAFYAINGITAYRLIMGPVLILLAIMGRYEEFKWLLPVSFATDLVDGNLARRFHVESKGGARMDSIADDLTIAASIVGMFIFKHHFAMSQLNWMLILFILFAMQTIYSLYTYRRITSYHTYLAKLAAILQGCFFILLFLINTPSYILFYAAAIVTGLELIEEIILIYFIPVWETDVKGLYWVLKRSSPK